MTRMPRHLPALLLAALCAALAATALRAWTRDPAGALVDTPGGAVAAPASARSAPASTVASAVVPIPSPDGHAVVSERPLFHASRRPAPPGASAAEAEAARPRPPPPPPALGPLELVGVTTAPDRRLALLRRGGGGPLLRVAEGQRVDGWTVVSIRRDAVVFRLGPSEAAVTFRAKGAGGAPAPAAAPPTRHRMLSTPGPAG